MKWVDYREKLKIGFNDAQKFTMMKNRLINFVDMELDDAPYSERAYQNYSNMVGEQCFTRARNGLHTSFQVTKSSAELISKYIAFYNTFENEQRYRQPTFGKSYVKNVLINTLDDLHIGYEIINDDDGMFVFPKGAAELDDALVSQPLEWLKGYPNARTAWIKTLMDYADATDRTASDVADKFRKALEAFFQEFFGGNKSLENYKSEYGAYLKGQGVPKEISGNLEALLQAYTNFMNNYAKHRDATSEKLLEYLMYQTGNIIRLLITLKQEEAAHAN